MLHSVDLEDGEGDYSYDDDDENESDEDAHDELDLPEDLQNISMKEKRTLFRFKNSHTEV